MKTLKKIGSEFHQQLWKVLSRIDIKTIRKAKIKTIITAIRNGK